jgi:hypothetical protein
MAQPRINEPARRAMDPGYQQECQSALEPSLSWLADQAVASGWDDAEVVYALMLISARRLLRRCEQVAKH